jgi:hypothetical protein
MKSIVCKAFLLMSLLSILPSRALPIIQKQDAAGEAIKLRTELILLEADALSKKTGQAIDGLKKEDFTLYEDGVRQDITHFSKDKLPLSVLILLDVSGSVWPSVKKLREGALRERGVALVARRGYYAQRKEGEGRAVR